MGHITEAHRGKAFALMVEIADHMKWFIENVYGQREIVVMQ